VTEIPVRVYIHCIVGSQRDNTSASGATAGTAEPPVLEPPGLGDATDAEEEAELKRKVRQNGQLLSRRGSGSPANASASDTHRDSIMLLEGGGGGHRRGGSAPACGGRRSSEADGGHAAAVSRPFPSWHWPILTEIYLPHAFLVNKYDILRANTPGSIYSPGRRGRRASRWCRRRR
jgi:hypothetical protein